CGEPEDFQGQFANKSRGHSAHERSTMGLRQLIRERLVGNGYALKVGQLTYDCRYSTMHGMPVTGGRGFRGLKPLWYNGVPPKVGTPEVEKLRETSRYPTGCSAPLSCSGPGTVLMLACQALVNPLLAHSKRLGISLFAGRYRAGARRQEFLLTIALCRRDNYQGSRHPSS